MPYHLYILRCIDDTLYTGITTDLHKRLEMHNSRKGAKYTRGRTPVTLIYQEKYPDRASATKREIEIKKLTKAQKQLLCSNQFFS